MTRKLTLLALIILAFASTATAASWSLPSTSVSYDDSTYAEITCTDSSVSNCPVDIKVKICGQPEKWDGTTSGNTVNYTMTSGSLVEVPQDYACTTGNHELSVYESSTFLAEGGSFKVEANGMNPHRGKNLIVNIDIGNNQLRNFQLTDNMWDVDTSPSAESGNILVQYYDDNIVGNNHQRAYKTFTPGTNPIMTGSSLSDSLSDKNLVDEESTSTTDTEEVFDKSFETKNYWKYGGVKDEWGISTQSPVHSNSEYSSDGELALGYEAALGKFTYYDNFTPSSDESDVVTPLSPGIDVDPSQTSEDVVMKWGSQISMNAEKTVTYTMNFDKKGHTRMEYRNSNGLVAYFNTDAAGTNDIWFYCYTCDDSIFETTTGTDGYGELPVDYQTGKDYEFEVSRLNGDLRFTIREDGSEIWAHTESNINDFGHSRLETWDTWSGGDTVKPEYGLKGMEINGENAGPYFYRCKEGATMKNGYGDQVPLVMETNGQLYQCQTSSSEWDPVAKCGDEFDNDGDGVIDLNDPECGSTTDTSEAPVKCSPRVGKLAEGYNKDGTTFSKGTKVAFFSEGTAYSDSTSNCAFADFDNKTDYTGQPPELFTCRKNIDGAISYSSSDSEDNGNAVDSSGADYFCTTLVNYHGNDEMKVVEYFAAKTDIPTGNNKYATTTGFKNNFYQTLHDAESKYAETNDLHDNDSYIPLGMANLGDGYDETSWKDHWIIGNTSAQNNEISSTDGTTDQNSVFNGGFAPKCESGKTWVWDVNAKSWECTGAASNWDQAVLVPDIQGQGMKSATVGIVVMPYNLIETSWDIELDSGSDFTGGLDSVEKEKNVDLGDVRSYKEAKADNMPDADSATDSIVPGLTDLNVTCYSDASPDSSFSKEVSLNVDEDNPKPVAVRGKVDLSSSSSYTCNWWYENSDNEKVENQGRPVDIANSGDKEDALFKFFKDDRGFSNLKRSYTPKEFETAASNW